MMLFANLRSLLSLMAFTIALVSGCGPATQTYTTEPTQVSTPEQRVKDWATGVAANGELDSGVDVIATDIEALRGKEGFDADALLKEFNQIRENPSPAKRKELAKTMAAKMP